MRIETALTATSRTRVAHAVLDARARRVGRVTFDDGDQHPSTFLWEFTFTSRVHNFILRLLVYSYRILIRCKYLVRRGTISRSRCSLSILSTRSTLPVYSADDDARSGAVSALRFAGKRVPRSPPPSRPLRARASRRSRRGRAFSTRRKIRKWSRRGQRGCVDDERVESTGPRGKMGGAQPGGDVAGRGCRVSTKSGGFRVGEASSFSLLRAGQTRRSARRMKHAASARPLFIGEKHTCGFH